MQYNTLYDTNLNIDLGLLNGLRDDMTADGTPANELHGWVERF